MKEGSLKTTQCIMEKFFCKKESREKQFPTEQIEKDSF